MNSCEIAYPVLGRCLYAENGVIEIYIPLDFGLRIGHLSFVGEENVFYVQPTNTTELTTKDGWRLRGGHRLWIAPESEKTYFPDNQPIGYEVSGESITLVQTQDTRLNIIKSITLTLELNRIRVRHVVRNVDKDAFRGSLWAVTSMSPGTEVISLKKRESGFDPLNGIALWDYTDLGDERASYKREEIVLRNLPVEGKYKIGVRHPLTPIRYEVNGVTFLKFFEIRDGEYPDWGVSYETFLCRHMTELESLSPYVTLNCGECGEHTEIWELKRQM